LVSHCKRSTKIEGVLEHDIREWIVEVHFYQTARVYIAEDSILYRRHCDSFCLTSGEITSVDENLHNLLLIFQGMSSNKGLDKLNNATSSAHNTVERNHM
jgi:hypothetical protein